MEGNCMAMDNPGFFKVTKMEIAADMLRSIRNSWLLWLVSMVGCILVFFGLLVDWRFFVAGMMVMLSIVPLLGFFVFYSCILSPGMIANVLPHTVEPVPDGYLVRVFRKVIHPDEDQNETVKWLEYQSMTIFESNVVHRMEKIDCSVLHLVDSPLSMLYLPKGMQPLQLQNLY